MLELAITSTVLYMLPIISNLEGIKEILFNIVERFLYALSVGIFNVSYPGITDYIHYDLFSFNLGVHVIKVVSSIILLTISVANYINLPKQSLHFTVEVDRDKYVLNQCLTFKNHVEHKILCHSNPLGELAINVKELWKDNKITATELEEVSELINTLQGGKRET